MLRAPTDVDLFFAVRRFLLLAQIRIEDPRPAAHGAGGDSFDRNIAEGLGLHRWNRLAYDDRPGLECLFTPADISKLQADIRIGQRPLVAHHNLLPVRQAGLSFLGRRQEPHVRFDNHQVPRTDDACCGGFELAYYFGCCGRLPLLFTPRSYHQRDYDGYQHDRESPEQRSSEHVESSLVVRPVAAAVILKYLVADYTVPLEWANA
jgi:hypothetical protein